MTRKPIRISEDLALPLDWVTLATVVYGARGCGKTSLGRVFAEEATKSRLRFCAIDLKGDWYGLKSSADGKQDGIPVVVFGGDHQDVPLEEGAGKFVGETVAKLEQSCILDLEYFSKGKQIRFLTEFFLSLYDANREPLLLLMDEAQRYAPQSRMPDPDSAKCLGAVEDLVKLGRKHGIGPVLFTQRGSGLNKEVSELCDLLVAFRTPGPLDQDRVKDWLDANTTKAQRDQVMGQLSGLATGTAVFASGHPDLKVFGVHAVRRPETFDSSATPKVGQRRIEPKKLAKPDLEGLREKMAAAIERAKADDPKALRAKIAGLETELAKARKSGVSVAAVVPRTVRTTETVRVETPVSIADVEAIERINEAIEVAVTGIHDALKGVRACVTIEMSSARTALRDFKRRKPTITKETTSGESAAPTQATAPSQSTVALRPRKEPSGDPSLGKCERSILTALVQFGSLRLEQVAIATVYSPRASTVGVAASKLKQLGHVEPAVERGAWAITRSGREALGEFEALSTGTELLAEWLEQLGRCEKEILRSVVGAHPGTVSMREAAEANGYSTTASTVGVAVSKLKKLALVSGPGSALQANERLVG